MRAMMMCYRRSNGGPLQSEYLENTWSNRATKFETCDVFITRTLKRALFPNCIFFERLSERAGTSWKAYGSPLALGFRICNFIEKFA